MSWRICFEHAWRVVGFVALYTALWAILSRDNLVCSVYLLGIFFLGSRIPFPTKDFNVK